MTLRLLRDMSSTALEWIQLCQAESLLWPRQDALAIVGSLTGVLVHVPVARTQVDRVCVTSALLRLAWNASRCLGAVRLETHATRMRIGRRSRVEMAIAQMVSLRSPAGATLRAVAARCGVSDAYLSRAFLSETGQHFWEAHHAVRIADATLLILGTRASIGQIAQRVGYGSTSELDRQCRRVCHMAPSTIRLVSAPRFATRTDAGADVRRYLCAHGEYSPANVADALSIDFRAVLLAVPSFLPIHLKADGEGGQDKERGCN
jgi:AraC-like DNA-binding protein